MKKSLTKLISRPFRVSDLPFLLLLLEAMSFVWSGFKIIYLRFPANAVVSTTEFDKPYTRWEAFLEPKSVGVHYFGDFLQPLDWATMLNPWTQDLSFLAMYPPVPVYALKLLTPFPYYTALWIYLTLMVISSSFAVWIHLSKFSGIARLSSSIAIGSLSAPALMAFDRGNNVGFVAILFSVFAYGVLREKKFTAVAALVLMSTIKIYPLLLIFVFIRLKWWKETLLTLSLGFCLTLGLFLITPGSVIETIRFWILANTEGSETWSYTLELGVKAFMSFLGFQDQILMASFASTTVSIWGIARYVVIVGILILAQFYKRVTRLEALALAGFSMILFYPAPHNYAWSWAIPMVGLLLNDYHGQRNLTSIKEMWNQSRIGLFTLFGLMFLLIPLPIAVPGTQKSLIPFLGYLLVFLVTYVGYKDWHRARRLKGFESIEL